MIQRTWNLFSALSSGRRCFNCEREATPVNNNIWSLLWARLPNKEWNADLYKRLHCVQIYISIIYIPRISSVFQMGPLGCWWFSGEAITSQCHLGLDHAVLSGASRRFWWQQVTGGRKGFPWCRHLCGAQRSEYQYLSWVRVLQGPDRSSLLESSMSPSSSVSPNGCQVLRESQEGMCVTWLSKWWIQFYFLETWQRPLVPRKSWGPKLSYILFRCVKKALLLTYDVEGFRLIITGYSGERNAISCLSGDNMLLLFWRAFSSTEALCRAFGRCRQVILWGSQIQTQNY